jgi:putative transposase
MISLTMVICKAFKFKLRQVSDADNSLFFKYAGCGRFVWNKALALQKERLDAKEPCLSGFDMINLLPGWKDEFTFLKEAPSQALQQRLMDLNQALREAFDKKNPKRFPKFKKKYRSNTSFQYPQGFEIEGNRIFLPKIGWLRFFKSREIEGKPKNVTVSYKAGSWFISIQTEMDVPTPIHPSGTAVGGDFGVKRLLTLSNGKHFYPVDAFRTAQKKLAKAQRKLSRMVKGSHNCAKQHLRMQKIHVRIANIRLDCLHKLTCDVSKNHALVVLEDLDIANMSASAKGTVENPGRNVKQKSGLNKAILDQGWGELKRQIQYKQLWRGGQVIFVPPAYSSQECSQCGHTSAENRPSQELFYCTKCGHTANADENAAKVVLSRAGHCPGGLVVSNGAVMPSQTGTNRVPS